MDHIIFDVEENVGVITLNRPEAANAQNERVLLELDRAWTIAEEHHDVKVIVLKSNGKHFSAGHDMSAGQELTTLNRSLPMPDMLYDWETRHYFHYAKRWRDVPKPSIAAVQGKCIAGGLMLCWPCDLIVAADNAEFSDPVLYMGLAGVEYHGHTWEFGARKAKELLFTGGSITAEEARQLGMVNRVVPLDDLMSETMALAHRISSQDSFALRMAKRAVNQVQDIQGFGASIEHVFDIHEFGHARTAIVSGGAPTSAALDEMKAKQQASSS
jgi:enoyl-CoA hydratase